MKKELYIKCLQCKNINLINKDYFNDIEIKEIEQIDSYDEGFRVIGEIECNYCKSFIEINGWSIDPYNDEIEWED